MKKKSTIGPLRKNDLKQYGYSTRKSDNIRHRALLKASDKYGAGSVLKKLNAVYVYNRNRAPFASSVFEKDKKWLHNKYVGGGHRRSSYGFVTKKKAPAKRKTPAKKTKTPAKRKTPAKKTKTPAKKTKTPAKRKTPAKKTKTPAKRKTPAKKTKTPAKKTKTPAKRKTPAKKTKTPVAPAKKTTSAAPIKKTTSAAPIKKTKTPAEPKATLAKKTKTPAATLAKKAIQASVIQRSITKKTKKPRMVNTIIDQSREEQRKKHLKKSMEKIGCGKV